MKTFDEYFRIILTGDREASRLAARQVRKLLYSSKEGGKYEAIVSIIKKSPEEYENIIEDWRRENFVVAVSVLYFLHDRESCLDFLFPWLYNLIQDPNGNIRHSAVRMFKHELGPLSYHIRFPNDHLRELSPKQADRILFEMFVNLLSLIKYLWKPVYKKYKYISSLPGGSYKSVQMVLGRLEEDCGKEYIAKLNSDCAEKW